MVDGKIVVRAAFPQGWRGDKYDEDEIMPATEKQAGRLTESGQAYYDFVPEEPMTEDLTTIPYDELLKPHFTRVEDVKNASDEELLSIDGLGEKRLQEIREYFDGD